MEFKAKRQRPVLELLQKKSHEQLTNAQKETASRDLEIEVENQVILPDDVLFRIFILLPVEAIVRLQYVCKRWFSVINSSIFIICHAEQSETVLICQKLTHEVGGKWKCCFHLLDFNHGESHMMETSVFELVDIRASYDGLVLASTARKTSLILMNPVTRKHIELPSDVDVKFSVGSFGIAFDNEAKTYKVVHLFIEESGYNGTEILSIDTQRWTRMDGPELLIDTTEIPVSHGGSLLCLDQCAR